MASYKDSLVTGVSRKWVISVVVGLDFCPFAKRELERGSVRFRASDAATVEECCAALLHELRDMNGDESVESVLLILPAGYEDFQEYLIMVGAAEACLKLNGYEGIYQLASFHPDYCFVDSTPDDAANYTNRSPYPMIHILRASGIEAAGAQHPDVDAIPNRNIEVARKLGADTLKAMLDQCRLDDTGNHLGG